mmetsp:Transcript_24582/g.47105  ORF Transcript_24582/g.47105 Transcript_24582/m.47105 type:complete len:148 (-) Transcript_24582:2383-2826(-)
MLMMVPESYLGSLKENERQNIAIYRAKDLKNGSLFQLFISSLKGWAVAKKENIDRSSMGRRRLDPDSSSILARFACKQRRPAVFRGTTSIFQLILTLYGVSVFSLCLSWTSTTADISSNMVSGLEITIVVLQGMFLLAVLFMCVMYI